MTGTRKQFEELSSRTPIRDLGFRHRERSEAECGDPENLKIRIEFYSVHRILSSYKVSSFLDCRVVLSELLAMTETQEYKNTENRDPETSSGGQKERREFVIIGLDPIIYYFKTGSPNQVRGGREQGSGIKFRACPQLDWGMTEN